MITKRIIPCLDVKDGKVVKGIGFENLSYAGDAVEFASDYYSQGADEIVLLDISASVQGRSRFLALVESVSSRIFIPLTVGGGIDSIRYIRELLFSGADKVSINSAAFTNQSLIAVVAEEFGSQCIVVAIDAKKKGSSWEAYSNSGKKPAGLDALAWAKTAQCVGAGEILLTSIDRDGSNKGFDLELTRQVSDSLSIPVIASGGAGTPESICSAFLQGNADAALLASMLHYRKTSIPKIKEYLASKGIPVRA